MTQTHIFESMTEYASTMTTKST